jgi:pumilio RNA-binding family
VLQKGAIEYRSAILLQVKNNVMEMSKHKFASNVIEKCFAYATNDEKGLLIDEIIGSEE